MMKEITIFLGNNCNANCSYCHSSKTPDKFNEISPNFIKWLESQSELTHVKFLGGEPTLYLDRISTIIENCNKNNNDVSYTIMTNGILLNNDDVINFLNENKILTIVSFDGIRGSRGYDDVFFREEYIPKLKKIHNLGAAATMSSFNSDIELIRKNYNDIEIMIGRYLPLFTHNVHVTSNDLIEFGLTDDGYENYFIFMRNNILRIINDFNHGVFNLKILHLLRDIPLWNNYSLDETRCYSRSHMIFDIDGNNHMCGYTRDMPIGSFGSEESFANQKKILDKNFPKCQSCDYRSMCGIACSKSIKINNECTYVKRYLSFLNSPEIKFKLSSIINHMNNTHELKKTGYFFNL